MVENEDGNEQRRRIETKLRRELGDDVIDALEDPDVVEIMLNPDGLLFEDRHGQGMKQIGTMAAVRALNLVGTVASMLGTVATAANSIVEGELPIYGARFEGIIPPTVAAASFAIRKKAIIVYKFADYLKQGIMSEEQLQVLDGHIIAGDNILVVGSTGSGKTTFCNAILDRIAELDPLTRIAILEDTRELQCPAINKIPMITNEFIDMNRLVKVCMRIRPDRIVVGEVRDRTAHDLVKAWGTGHSGGVATVHADSATAGLTRIEQLIQEANVPPNKAVIAAAIKCIVSIQRTKHGRRVQEIVTVKGADASAYQLEP